MIFRYANLNDIPQLIELEQNCFQTDRLTNRHFRYLIRSSSTVIMVAEKQKRIIANAVLLLRKNSKKARLYSLAVNPANRHQGIARSLCQMIEQEAFNNQCHSIFLEVRKDNKSANHFYLNNGYQIFSEYKKFYADGEDAFRMQKKLSS